VVAAEVKSLAAQTAKATEEIAQQIGSIQSAADDPSQAIAQVAVIIREMSAIATTARSTASGVKDLADSVAVEAESLEAEVRQFLDSVQAA
jgi:methyl-accepting chemotaxis protein